VFRGTASVSVNSVLSRNDASPVSMASDRSTYLKEVSGRGGERIRQ
jgi:hypothetical protein